MAIETIYQTNITLKGSDVCESITFKIDKDDVEVVAAEQDQKVNLLFTRQELAEFVAAVNKALEATGLRV